MKHILSVLVENKSGVLSRVTGMISRRGFNIESLTVAPTEDSTMSRLTAIVNADEVGYEQITKQLHKLVSVYKITDLTDEDAIERELALFKVSAPPIAVTRLSKLRTSSEPISWTWAKTRSRLRRRVTKASLRRWRISSEPMA